MNDKSDKHQKNSYQKKCHIDLDVACKIALKMKQKKYGIRRIFFCDKQVWLFSLKRN